MTVINVGKLACDQIEIVCFGVDIIAKRNVVILAESSFKLLEIQSPDKH